MHLSVRSPDGRLASGIRCQAQPDLPADLPPLPPSIDTGQLDGGHILYALLLRRAHRVAQLLLLAAIVAVVIGGYWVWTLMILLLMLVGPVHPPTANDHVPLGTSRRILGWASLAFVFVGFTPVPFSFEM